MGFHAPKNSIPLPLRNTNFVIDLFKAMVIEMSRRGKTDKELENFAKDPCPESLGLQKDPYRDYVFVQIQERTKFEERIEALQQLADSGKI